MSQSVHKSTRNTPSNKGRFSDGEAFLYGQSKFMDLTTNTSILPSKGASFSNYSVT